MNRQQAAVPTLDLRTIAAHERRPLVFDIFTHLLPGDEMVLVHNHHSRSLFYMFLAEAPRGFTWDYLEQGPEVWRIRIEKNLMLANGACYIH